MKPKPIDIEMLMFAGDMFLAVHKAAARGERSLVFVKNIDGESIEYELRITRVNGKRVPSEALKMLRDLQGESQ